MSVSKLNEPVQLIIHTVIMILLKQKIKFNNKYVRIDVMSIEVSIDSILVSVLYQ